MTLLISRKASHYVSNIAFILLVATVAAILTSSRGYEIDALISYLTGLRHLSGQLLYIDFYIPHGPISGWLFALALKILPTGGSALISISALLNVVAAYISWKIVFATTQSAKHSYIAGILTIFQQNSPSRPTLEVGGR